MLFRLVGALSLFILPFIARAQHAFMAFDEPRVTSDSCLYVDDSMPTDAAKGVFSSVNEALKAVEKRQHEGSTGWTTVYIAPSVYWIDNPDEPALRLAEAGDDLPYGLKLRINRVRMVGLSQRAEDVVLACQRGQTQGAVGNFTMLRIEGSDISAENITFGNYTNVDLDYKKRPLLSRKARAVPIVQAQIAVCEGDRYALRNCRFLSRLNLCPFVGPAHVRFEDCYFECTDDALCGTGDYVSCRFTWFSSKPFYATCARGATFLDCDIHCKTRGVQYLTKVSSPVRLTRCRFTSDDPSLTVAWTRRPDPKDVCEMTGCTLNGKPLLLPPTPDVPMSVAWPLFEIANQPRLIPGRWTYDACCPEDVGIHAYAVDTLQAAWAYGEGVDGAEGVFGLLENVRGSRMRYTAFPSEHYGPQRLTLSLTPCKSAGQGFGSATGQYLDVCVKYDTETGTGFGIRFERTTRHDRAVDVQLVAYRQGVATALTAFEKCALFRRGCQLTLSARDNQLVAEISNGEERQKLSAPITMNAFGGLLIQHTGSAGASATVIGALRCDYD